MGDSVQIRLGQLSDIHQVFNLVKELAIFENEPDAVTAKINDYKTAFKKELIGVLVAETNDIIVGMTLFYDTFSTWKGKMLYLEDFVVKAEYRSKGIGDLLFTATIAEAKRRSCKMIKWQVLDWNKRAIDFYERKGATIEKQWWNGKIIF